jgi:hypothetical protein
MKIEVTMKDPDTLYDAVGEAVRQELSMMENIDDDEKEILEESRREKIQAICSKWFEYGEYLTVVIDTDAMTATVKELK